MQRSEKRTTGRSKNRGRSAGEDNSMDADCKHPAGPEADSAEGTSTDVAGRGKTMSFLRSRLYKARSLGCLVKERILVEASHCQYEIWKRLGRKGAMAGGGVAPSDVNMNAPTLSPTPAKLSSVTCSASTECSTPTPLAVVHNVTQHCSSC